MPIPKKIIQTHKTERLGAEYKQSWKDMNPEFSYQFFDDASCRSFFESHLPDMLETYDKLPLAVQKADLFRYAYIYIFGGVYSDVDTICHAPLETYINFEQDHLVVGVEMYLELYKFDVHRYTQNYISPFQILQWTFASSPKHPALKDMLQKIYYMVSTMTTAQIEEYSKNQRFVLELTGPMVFTQTITHYLSNPNKGNVTLLNQIYWGFSPWHNTDNQETIKVRHLYDASWKKNQSKLYTEEQV